MNIPLVSIIIPIYNAEKYLRDTINSAISQSWSNKEIIIIDDGSTDKSLAIAQSFENNFIKVYNQANAGASVARNHGLKKANGTYIQFLDADDLLSENKIESQLSLLSDKPNYIALCGTIHFQDGSNPFEMKINHEWYAEESAKPVDFLIKLYGGYPKMYGGMIQPNAWLTPKHIIEKAGYWNEMRNPDDDGEFFCRVLLAAEGIAYSFDALNYYRKFDTNYNLSAQKNEASLESIFKSTLLKSKHLIAATSEAKVHVALSNLFWEVAETAYPRSRRIANLAIKEAKKNSNYIPDYFYTHTKFYRFITKYLGWKTSALLSYYKQRITKLRFTKL